MTPTRSTPNALRDGGPSPADTCDRHPVLSRRLPADAAAALAFLSLSLVLHLALPRPEGVWVIESSTTRPEHGKALGHRWTTGTLCLEPTGHYRFEGAGRPPPDSESEGSWAATFDGFELREGLGFTGRLGALAVPVARLTAGGTAELTFLDGHALHLRRVREL